MNKSNRISILEELKKRPFIKQRTEEWFKLRENRLTASDLYDAVYYPTTLIKKKIKNVSFNSNAIPALKWGCMFEKIACDIYAHLNNTHVNEFGLLINDKINNFGASPDGITDDGIMIEIKCPYSREIKNNEIPKKYYYQMQGQMAVCELDICDYIECKFKQFNNKEEYIETVKNLNENYKHGIIAEIDNNYIYSTFNKDYNENIEEMRNYNKCVYWMLEIINIQRINFDKNKWDNEISSKIIEYWNLYQDTINKNNNKSNNLFIEEDD